MATDIKVNSPLLKYRFAFDGHLCESQTFETWRCIKIAHFKRRFTFENQLGLVRIAKVIHVCIFLQAFFETIDIRFGILTTFVYDKCFPL